jgi:hypothetical protein
MLKTKKLIAKKLAANQVVVTVQDAFSNVLSAVTRAGRCWLRLVQLPEIWPRKTCVC